MINLDDNPYEFDTIEKVLILVLPFVFVGLFAVGLVIGNGLLAFISLIAALGGCFGAFAIKIEYTARKYRRMHPE